MLNPSLKKITAAVLAGIVFFVGGLEVASAATPAIDQANQLLGSVRCTDWIDCLSNLPAMLFLGGAYLGYILSAAVLSLSGYLFDAVLALSIDGSFIDKPFVDSVWAIVRDFSNMLFIFVLIYAGIQTMFGLGQWAKTVRNVVIIALLINFSLFFTKVIIDAGNILAVGVYSAIGVVNNDTPHTQGGTVVERSVSESLVAQFGPQNIFSIAQTAGGNSAYLVVAVFCIGMVINALVAWTLFRVTFVFVGRVIGFWFLMMISPFAFISITIPELSKNFNKWLESLLGLAFVAPVFLFFLYLIMTVLSKGHILDSLKVIDPSGNAGFSLDALFGAIVMVIFIYLGLNKAVDFAKEMSGSFGTLGSHIASAVVGIAATVATGGAAAGLRATVGASAHRELESGTLQARAADASLSEKERAKARARIATLETRRTSAYDLRKSDNIIAKQVTGGAQSLGIKTDMLGKVKDTGGYAGEVKKTEQELLKTAAKMETTESEKAAIQDKYAVEAKKGEQQKQEQRVTELQGRVQTAENSQAMLELRSLEKTLEEQKAIASALTARRAAAETALKDSPIINPALQKAVDDARVEESAAVQSLTSATDKKEAAAKRFAESAEGMALAAIKKDRDDAVKMATAAKEAAKKAEDEAKAETTRIDNARRAMFADVVAANIDKSSKTKEIAEKTARSIRAGNKAEKSELEKIKEELKKELEKEQKEKGGGH